MRKKKSLVVSLALALLLVLSAPFTLLFNKTDSAKAEIANAVDGAVFFDYTVDQSKAYYEALRPRAAVVGEGLSYNKAQYENKGILVRFAKDETGAGPNKAVVNSVDVSDNTKDDKLLEIAYSGSGTIRAYRIKISDGTNTINLYQGFGVSDNNTVGWITNRAEAVYVQASGQSKIGGLTDGATGTFVANSAATAISVADATGTPVDSTKSLVVYYDATEKAIYVDNASGAKTLVRDLDATDATNGEDTAFAGFTGNVTIEVGHRSGGGWAAETDIKSEISDETCYGAVFMNIDGLDLDTNALGYLASYNTDGSTVTNGAYVPSNKTVAAGMEATVPALARKDAAELASGEGDGWTDTVYNAAGEDVTTDVLSGNVVTFDTPGKYAVYRTKTVEGVTSVVTYGMTAVATGFENELGNIFDSKATDGVGKAKPSLPVDLTTGVATTTSLGVNNGVQLTYEKAYQVSTATGAATDYLNHSVATVGTVNISDNTKSDPLVSLYVKNISEIASVAIVVTEVADPTNGFAVSTWIGTSTENMTRANAGAFTQHPFGTRGATGTADHTLAASGGNIGNLLHNFYYDKEENAVYINDNLVRDFDATGAEAWKNGSRLVSGTLTPFDDNANDPIWEGFKTDEVQIHIVTLVGAGDMYVADIDGNNLSYDLIETATGYTAGLVTPLAASNYNATTFANIGETVTVPAPTSKTLTGAFVERTDITVAKVKVNDGEAVAYTAGETSFIAVGGINKIEYLDSSDAVLATAYVKAYDQSLNGAVSGATAEYGAQSIITGLRSNNKIDYHTSGGMGARFSTLYEGLKITAERPEGELTEDNNTVSVSFDKAIYVGDNDGTAPLFEFAYAPEYLTQQLLTFSVTIADEGGNTVELVFNNQVPKAKNNLAYYGASVMDGLSPIYAFANGVKANLRQNSSQWYNGNGFVSKGVYVGGYQPGKLSIYYDAAAQTLSVGEGQSYGDNNILIHLNPTAEQRSTMHYPAAHTGFDLGERVTLSFKFAFSTEENYTDQTITSSIYFGSGKPETASVIFTNIDGQSLVQTDNAYVSTKEKIAASVADVTGTYKAGDTITVPAVDSYYDFFADGGVVEGTVDGYTVDVTYGTDTVATALEAGATFTAASLGEYTLTYKFANRSNVVSTVAVTDKTVTLSANNMNFAIDLEDSVGLSGSLPNYVLAEGGTLVIKMTPNAGWALTSATLGGAEQLGAGEIIFAGETKTFTYEYADLEAANAFAAVLTQVYTVTFDSADGTAVNPQSVVSGAKATEPTAPTKAGYAFKGWKNGSDAYDFDTPVTGDVTLTASWVAAYAVTFNADGGTAVDTQYIEDGSKAAEPTAPTKDGYVFKGWVVDGTTDAYDFNSAVTAAVSLKAVWNELFDVTFDVNGGEGTYTAQSIENGAKATEPDTDPTKAGYTFAGWYVGETAYDFDAAVTADVALTAKWTINAYSVTFSDGVAAQTVNHGAKVTKPADPAKAGYTFAGWYNGAVAWNFDTDVVTGNVALTAKWEINVHTVTFNVDGGSAIAAQSVVNGGTVVKPADPTKEGYTFAGWYVGETAYDFDTTITADTELKAKWTAVAADTTPDDTTPDDTTPDEKKGCGEEAVGLLAVVLSALAAAFVIKKK